MKSFQLMNSSLLKHSENIPYTVMCHLSTIKKRGFKFTFKSFQSRTKVRVNSAIILQLIIYKTFIQESTKGGILSKYATLCDGSAVGTSFNSLSTKAVILDTEK